MTTYPLTAMTGGWFIGDFQPSVLQTSNCEVGIKTHRRGARWPTHFHALCTEINVLLHGRMTVNGRRMEPGTIFVVEPGEVIRPRFVENCELAVIKIPGLRGDKHVVR